MRKQKPSTVSSKKKSGTRNRRNPLASAEDRTPATHTGGNGTPAEGEMEEDENGDVAVAPVAEVVPTCYRWISNLATHPRYTPREQNVSIVLGAHIVTTNALPVDA